MTLIYVADNPRQITAGLGDTWHTELIRIKLHACVGGSHGQIEVLERLQDKYPERFAREKLQHIRKINVHLSHAIYAHDGWVPESRPLTETGAQMNAAVRMLLLTLPVRLHADSDCSTLAPPN